MEKENINKREPHQSERKGLAHLTQGMEKIPYLSFEEDLKLWMESLPHGLSRNNKIDLLIYELFLILKDFLKSKGVNQWRHTITTN